MTNSPQIDLNRKKKEQNKQPMPKMPRLCFSSSAVIEGGRTHLLARTLTLLNGRVDDKNQFLKLGCESNGAVDVWNGTCEDDEILGKT